ncbi:cupin [Herbiconiux flava]|nr:cupin domain-containing protein [Herbiconiux flava]GLK15933.1 cupin [Herbiconiux flava]
MPEPPLGDLALVPGRAVDLLALALPLAPVAPSDVEEGEPRAGSRTLTRPGSPNSTGGELGVWTLEPGVVTDVEIDETFVVVAGRGTVEIEGGPAEELRPGILMSLTAGMRTRWTITETLRKVYLL